MTLLQARTHARYRSCAPDETGADAPAHHVVALHDRGLIDYQPIPATDGVPMDRRDVVACGRHTDRLHTTHVYVGGRLAWFDPDYIGRAA